MIRELIVPSIICADIFFKIYAERKKAFEERYPYIVKNNFWNRATLIENSVFLAAFCLFAVFTILSIRDREYVPASAFCAFSMLNALLLYTNNAAKIYSDGTQVHIRSFLRRHTYALADFEDFTQYTDRHKCVFVFKGVSFSVPSYYHGISNLVHLLRFSQSPFSSAEGIAFLKDYIQKKTGRKAFRLVPSDAEPALCSTKLGGLPYWEPNQAYPTDEKGKKMLLLCQLNFGDCKDESGLLPQSGILQFFISADEELEFGMSDGEYTEQRNFRVVFHEAVDPSVTEADVTPLVPAAEEIQLTPILKSTALSFEASESYMSDTDCDFVPLLRSAACELTGKELNYDIYDFLGGYESGKEIYQMLNEKENSVLCHPAFIHYDVRESLSDEDAAYFDTAMLFLNSESGGGKFLEIGDSGVAMFLINGKALRARDFSKILYYWDCY